ncbi:pirin family protein [Nonomuraea sp. NPDC050556]|uniref:pirin family protein n=1 Tax=Nonomuraea sp. NPDC050556 TaxID=3364369 RepID=UPI0037B3EA80
MSNLEQSPAEIVCEGQAAPGAEILTGHTVALGGPRGMNVTRTLPSRRRRMIGPWCFVDAYGPEVAAMRVPPHPHTGLQTVSWLIEGEVLHRDSVGSLQVVRPGQLNLMTAGAGISHSEESRETVLHGAQLWVALPEAHRHQAPHFEHHADLPVFEGATVIMGSLGGVTSPAAAYSPLVAAELTVDGQVEVPVEESWEHGLLFFDDPGSLHYFGPGHRTLTVSGRGRVLLIGGEPFGEQLVMWWNFVGRSHEEIVAFRRAWMDGSGFGQVVGFDGAPLPAPGLPTTPLKPR